MHSAVQDMIEKYNCQTTDDYRNALKEIVQEIALLGLYRGGFFNTAAFYGGTCLRIFYKLDRFSEDLDFSLLSPGNNFDMSQYTRAVRDELGAYGFDMTVTEKVKSKETAIKSAFIKGGTHIHLLKISSIMPPVQGVHPNELIQIKLEVDTDPPAGAEYEIKYQLVPVPYYVRVFTLPSLFAGKMHALLCRDWQSRVKGRDFYDYIWYLSKGVSLNLQHLISRMRQSGHLGADEAINEKELHEQLSQRFSQVDFEQAKRDVLPFVKDSGQLELWSGEFFSGVTRDKLNVS